MTIKQLKENEYHEYYGQYIFRLDKALDLREGFKTGKQAILQFFKGISEEKQNHRYAEGKWSIKEIFQHLIDTERVFMYRCFRIARNDETALAGFDQNIYMEPSNANQKSMDALLAEYETVRNASISLLNSLSDDNLRFIGNANESAMSARAAAFIIIGHEIWHREIIEERYL